MRSKQTKHAPIPLLCAAAVALMLGSAGCFDTGSDAPTLCSRDDQCAEICSRGGECIAQSDAIEIRARWTVGGQTPSPSAPGPCGGIDAFEVSLESEGSRDRPIVFFPVPCDLGQVYYDRMSNNLRVMRMSSVAPNGNILEVLSVNIEGPSTEATFDFRPQ